MLIAVPKLQKKNAICEAFEEANRDGDLFGHQAQTEMIKCLICWKFFSYLSEARGRFDQHKGRARKQLCVAHGSIAWEYSTLLRASVPELELAHRLSHLIFYVVIPNFDWNNIG